MNSKLYEQMKPGGASSERRKQDYITAQLTITLIFKRYLGVKHVILKHT